MVKYIDKLGFAGADNLTEIKVDDDNQSFESIFGMLYNKTGNCLLSCPSGKTGVAVIPRTVTEICGAFFGCYNLREIVFEDNEIERIITENTFAYCNSLVTINIPNGVKILHKSTIHDCENLQCVRLPSTIVKIRSGNFKNCPNLKKIIIEPGDRERLLSLGLAKYADKVYERQLFKDKYGVCYDMDMKCLVSAPKNLLGEYKIIEGTRTIGLSAFYQCKDLTNVVFPESLVFIDTAAFSMCTGLTSVSFPKNVLRINAMAFQYCENINTINFLNGLEYIDVWAFSGCANITKISIPQSVKYICRYAFSICDKLVEINLPETLKCRIDKYAFADCLSLREYPYNWYYSTDMDF